MHSTKQLRKDHDGLMALVSQFQQLIAAPAPPAGVDLVKFRQAFSKQMFAHLAREDMLLYPALLRSKNPVIARTAQTFMAEMGGMLEAYKQWSVRWPTERLTLEWSKFAEETSSLLRALSQRVARENLELYPLIEDAAAIAA